jgi:hypothetical protein
MLSGGTSGGGEKEQKQGQRAHAFRVDNPDFGQCQIESLGTHRIIWFGFEYVERSRSYRWL